MSKKYLLFLFVFIVGVSAKGQTYDNVIDNIRPVFNGNIKRITEKSVKYPDSWREFEFDTLYRIKEKRYFRENNLVQTENREYVETDSLLIVKRQINNEMRIVHFVDKIYFDSNNRTKRHEVFYSSDTISPMNIFTNFIFNGNDIIQYDRILINNKDTFAIELYEKQYIKDRLSVTKKTDNREMSSFTQTLKYDKKGNLISEIIDYNNPEYVLTGRTWSRWRRDKYRIDYKYDNHGNWTERYTVTWLKKYKVEIRVIEYD